MATMAQARPHRPAPTHGIRSVARQLRRHKGAFAGLLVLLLLSLVALSAPLLAPYDPLKVQARKALRPPSSEFFLGTDQYGQRQRKHLAELCVVVNDDDPRGMRVGVVRGVL